MTWTGDYAAQGELAPVLLGESHGAYVRIPHQRPEVLRGLMRAYSRALATSNLLGTSGLPSLAARAVQQCPENLTSKLDSSDALQACGLLHLSAAWAADAQADHDTAATHLDEPSALAARMDTEVGTWANLWFGPTNVCIWKTSIALERCEHGQALQAAQAVHPQLLPATVHQAGFWADVGRALAAEKKTGTRLCACR